MPKRTDIKKIVVIGSGPIVIGQAAEFDYAGTQACLALREEGYEVVLINSNPATIMTDPDSADQVYIEPITLDFVSQILRKERPDALLATLGGQTGLNMAIQLANSGILDALHIEVLGTNLEAIQKAEDRDKFKQLMIELNEPIPNSAIVHTVQEALDFASSIGYPVIVRPAYTLGGTGGGICDKAEVLIEIVENGLKLSPVHQCLIETSIAGFKEIEYEVMRDRNDNAIVVCNMENFDPVGIHTGDSIVFAPCQTLTDVEHQMLRNASLKIIRALKIEGGCNVQLALHPKQLEYFIIEVNPRVSRSSALASKATGYPIAKIAAKIAVGLTLDEIMNPVTLTTYAQFEPALDYVVTKIPRWPFDKFQNADRRLSTQMKATGEVMALGRSLEESLLKAVRSLELGVFHIQSKEATEATEESLALKLIKAEDDRLFYVAEALRRGYTVEDVAQLTKIDAFFIDAIQHIVELEVEAELNPGSIEHLKQLKRYGFADRTIGELWKMTEQAVRKLRIHHKIVPVFKMVDTCAAEFASKTPYFYATYELENESIKLGKPSVIVLGSGPIRIGQGIEFDYATVHCVRSLRAMGYQAIVINSNPETVSTDFSIADKLYFDPLTFEDVMHVVDLEQALGVIVQFGGQTAINLAQSLHDEGVRILGTSVDDLDRTEDRKRFEATLKALNIQQPQGAAATTSVQAIKIAEDLTYPVLVRPSYVIGGRAMEIVYSKNQLESYLHQNPIMSPDRPLLVDRYLIGLEIEVDALCDGKDVLIPGIMEHIERAGVHSGDSMAVYPPQRISEKLKQSICDITTQLALELRCIGIMNIQFVIQNDIVYVIEANPRASRTVPFLSKVTGIPMAEIATQIILGKHLKDMPYGVGLYKESKRVHVKAPVFSFTKLNDVDAYLGPEMKSTGEVMGSDTNLDKALYKAFTASGVSIQTYGTVLFTIDDDQKTEALELAIRFEHLGYNLIGTKGTAQYFKEHGVKIDCVAKQNDPRGNTIIDRIERNELVTIINTTGAHINHHDDGRTIRSAAITRGIPLFTSLDTVNAIIRVLEARSFEMETVK